MADKFKKFAGAEITVEFSPTRCIHTAKCVHALPTVFNPDARPWIKPDAEDAAATTAAVAQCPSGALRFKLKHGPQEKGDAAPSGQVRANGPVYLRGQLGLGDARETRLALCRCGASHNKPLCDGSHDEIRFKDDGCGAATPLAAAEPKAGALKLAPLPNGPVHVEGPLTLKNARGDVIYQGEKCFLCRCGASKGKPMCDGSHAAAGFKS